MLRISPSGEAPATAHAPDYWVERRMARLNELPDLRMMAVGGKHTEKVPDRDRMLF